MKKVFRWILSFLIFNLLFALGSYLSELYLDWWVLIKGGWKWIAILPYIFIIYCLVAVTIVIASLVSPERFRTPIYIRWYSGVCLIFGFIYSVKIGFNFNIQEINNLIFLLIVVFTASPKNLGNFLKNSDI